MNSLLLRSGNSATEVLYTFTKTEILLQIMKKFFESFAYVQCSKDPQSSISACISNFDHPTQILEEFIQCCGRKVHTVADGKISSQVQERKDSVHKTFVRGPNLITSLKN